MQDKQAIRQILINSHKKDIRKEIYNHYQKIKTLKQTLDNIENLYPLKED